MAFRSHIKQEEQEDEENHLCTLCNVVFNTLDELLCHKEDHDPEIGVHSCYLCGEVCNLLTTLDIFHSLLSFLFSFQYNNVMCPINVYVNNFIAVILP